MNTTPSPPPAPAAPTPPDLLPDALTFFLTRAQRRAVLARLNTNAPNRTAALLALLGIPNQPRDTPRGPAPDDQPQSTQRGAEVRREDQMHSPQSPQRAQSTQREKDSDSTPAPPPSRSSRSSP